MKYILKFNENISIYDKSWEVFLPKQITVIEGSGDKLNSRHVCNKGNVM